MDEQVFDHFERLLDVPEEGRAAIVDTLDLTPAQRTRLRGLLESATNPDTFDAGVASMFPSLLRPSGFPDTGYELIREIGRGGMGVVYLAEDTDLKRYVAVKVIGAAAWDEAWENRALHEARAAARLDHPGIVPVHHSGRLDHAVYIISAYIEGETLSDSVRRERARSGLEGGDRRPLTRDDPATNRRWIDHVVGIVRGVAGAVEYAHQQSVVHRDIKPSNILLDENDRPFLTDFGIAKLTDHPEMTWTGAPMGTLLYMSPEQVGVVDDDIGPRADVYGLGVVLFEALTLRRPYEIDSMVGLIRAFDLDTPPDPRWLNPAVPRALSQICRRALATRPEKRHASAAEFASDLEQALRGEFTASRFSLAPVRRLLRRRKIALTAAAAVAITAAITAVIVGWETPPRGSVVLSSAATDRVTVRRIDPVTRVPDAPQEVSPRGGRFDLEPGRYRIAVEEAGFTREFMCTVDDAGTVSIGPYTRDEPPNTQDMALIAGGRYTIGTSESTHWLLVERRIDIEPFWMDTTEVSNKAYRRFVLATGHEPPPIWPEPYDPAWDPLPVVAVNVDDARAYAEWMGKRLPTAAEWEIAASGFDRRKFVWGNDYRLPSGMSLGNAQKGRPRSDFDDPETTLLYLDGVVPVDTPSDELDRTESGLLNMCGNVEEWTDTLQVADNNNLYIGMGMAKGNSWMVLGSAIYSNQGASLVALQSRRSTIGFRCVISDSALGSH